MIRTVRQIVEGKLFHRAIVATIGVAGLVVGLETSPRLAAEYGVVLQAVDRVILGIFLLEALLKIAAHGRRPWRYFGDGWNVFDFGILVLCLLPAAGPFAAVLRLARVLRLLRLVSALPKLQLLVGALLRSLSAMGYVGLLLGVLFYIYAVAGIHLFGAHDPKNFGSLPVAFLSLFRLVTLDNWADLFYGLLPHVSGVKVGAYFVTFIVLGTMIILNLFIGIIMNSMSETHAEIAERERAQRELEAGAPSPDDELEALEREVEGIRARVAALRRRERSPRRPRAREREGVAA